MVVRAKACYPLQYCGTGYTAEKEEVEMLEQVEAPWCFEPSLK